jgi:hypothetical protein
VVVDWVDKDGWYQHVGILDPRWLTVVDKPHFDGRAEALRTSSWAGFPPGEY